jgi:hypothetical protein
VDSSSDIRAFGRTGKLRNGFVAVVTHEDAELCDVNGNKSRMRWNDVSITACLENACNFFGAFIATVVLVIFE